MALVIDIEWTWSPIALLIAYILYDHNIGPAIQAWKRDSQIHFRIYNITWLI